MKFLQDLEDAKAKRKSLKPLVERRRRERMNRSLESLKTLLQPQEANQRRVEKAEMLEHTVLFLKNTAKGENMRAGGQTHSFQEGISTCLQRAAHFLGPAGKGLWLGSALDASFAARLSCSDSDPAGVRMRTEAGSSSSLPHTKSILRLLRQKSKHSFAHPYQLPAQQEFPRIPQQVKRQNQLEIRVERRPSKQSPSQNLLVSQTLWRPWP
ncbi:transcription factor HES-2-like [Micropterus salmoides]|uniref:transcription factor HES-2-like n=1 Tax=Micropterus salmoides TaxID=27706 RepID=UPI0018EB8195|nr:transcription factor HES-2-like [Micropterus salmoides]